VKGTRQGKRLLIEKFDESDFAGRYTVKRYTSRKTQLSEDEWAHETIRLEPLNPEFQAFDLSPDAFRVIGEFVEVLES
jgi:SOS-response transcriptional repressor LexA